MVISLIGDNPEAGAPGLLEVSPGRENCLLLRVHLPYWEGLIQVVDRVGLLLGAGVARGYRSLHPDASNSWF